MGTSTSQSPLNAALSRRMEWLYYCSRILGFALLIAAAARIEFPLAGTPVPATLLTFAVLLAGGLLGPIGAIASVTLYLVAGVSGAPIFAFGGGPLYLLGPTGGYLLGCLPAAGLTGILARRAEGLLTLFGSFVLACLVIYLFGWAQLTALLGPEEALKAGILPFIILDTLKALVAAAIIRRIRERTGADFP